MALLQASLGERASTGARDGRDDGREAHADPRERGRCRRGAPGGARPGRRSSGFSLVDQTKIVTAASELARNTLDYGGGGTCCIEALERGRAARPAPDLRGPGPGIADIALALTDGYTTGSGLGLGLSGSQAARQRVRHRVQGRARARASPSCAGSRDVKVGLVTREDSLSFVTSDASRVGGNQARGCLARRERRPRPIAPWRVVDCRQ